MRTRPPPLPGTWQHYALATIEALSIVSRVAAEAIGCILYVVGWLALFCLFFPIMIPYYVIKWAVAAGIREGNRR